jgi:hypothetical protein
MSSRVKRFVKKGILNQVKHPTGREEKKDPIPTVFRRKKSESAKTEGVVVYLLSGRRVII